MAIDPSKISFKPGNKTPPIGRELNYTTVTENIKLTPDISTNDPDMVVDFEAATQAETTTTLQYEGRLTGLPDGVRELSAAGIMIRAWQESFDMLDQQYNKMLAVTTLKAWNTPYFPDKKDATVLRTASNESERDLAVQLEIANSKPLADTIKERAETLAFLLDAKREYEVRKYVLDLRIAEMDLLGSNGGTK